MLFEILAISLKFPSVVRAMCWAHMIRAIDDRLRSIKDRTLRQSLRSEIELLQMATSRDQFFKRNA